MELVIAVLGLAIVVTGLLDMFQTLLYPSGNGWLSTAVMRAVWWLSKLSRHRMRSASGAVAMMAVILMWLFLQVLGWALVYYPYVPEGFAYAPNIDHTAYNDFAEAYYLSLVTIATLGFGDVVGTGPWLRFAPALEAVAGFALLTAALAWFSQVWPPLARRRSLAAELRALGDAGVAGRLSTWDPVAATLTLRALARQLLEVRSDFTQHSEQFYFQEADPDTSLAKQLVHAVALRDAAQASADATVRDAGIHLGLALEDLATTLARQFLSLEGDVDETIDAYHREHYRGVTPGSPRGRRARGTR